jgi:hypothetical protein
MTTILRTRAIALLALLALVSRPASSQEAKLVDSAAYATARSAQTIGLLTTVIPVVVGGGLIVAARDEGAAFYVGYLLASSGVIFGPSIADWRGGLHGRGVGGMFLRMGFAWGGLIAAGIVCQADCEDQTAIEVVLFGSQAAALGLAVWELATVKHRVIKANEGKVSFTPTYSPETGAIGFAARVRF